MTKKLLILSLLLIFLGITSYGCVKLNTYSHKRVDLEMQGNKGYVVGNPPIGTSVLEKEDRKVLQLEITVPGRQKEESTSTSSESKSKKAGSPRIK